jgi:pentafunctional AROM polypeptide
VISGMRGSGKTHIGEIAALSLGWPFLDADRYFEEKHQVGVKEFVAKNGWPAFREAETEVLKELLKDYPVKRVISLGGGIVETPAARDALKSYSKKGPVVHIVRDIEEIVAYLGSETARPAYGESIEDVYNRRAPWYAEICNYKLPNNTSSGPDPKAVAQEVSRFFKHVTGQSPNHAPNLAEGKKSYFLSLTYPDIKLALPHIDEITTGVDALELRVDLLRDQDSFEKIGSYAPSKAYVSSQLAALRLATSLPIVFTVRTVSQGGSFPDTAEAEAFELFDLAVSAGVEYIDVEISWSAKRISGLVSKKGQTKIIASWHDWSGKLAWDGTEVKQKYQDADKFGDIIKIVGKANTLEDNFSLHSFVKKVTAAPGSKPVLAINMGVAGQMSRILNSTFSPVTHPLLPNKAAPGQLSFKEIQTALSLIGQLPPQKYYLFGTPISHSMSPTLHNTGFEALGLPHRYELLETKEVGEEIKAIITAPEFGGASVTIPFKLDVIPLLDSLSPEAKTIGAVNTITPIIKPDGSRTLRGDNTDWRGIREAILSRLPTRVTQPDAGLIIGAGGTSRAAIHALQTLGTKKIYLFNRTKSSAQALVDTFPDAKIELIESLGNWSGSPPTIVVSTVPASATVTEQDTTGSVYLPESIFEAHSGIVVDMAYKPAETPLLALAKTVGKGWQSVKGVEVLLEQGYVQFELWTGRRAPKKVIAQAVLKKYGSS